MNRSEHLHFHKSVALLHLKSLSIGAAFDVFVAGLKKHPELRKHPSLKAGIQAMFKGEIDTLDKLETFIHSIN